MYVLRPRRMRGADRRVCVCVVSAKAGARSVVSRSAREDVAAAAAAAVQRKRARYSPLRQLATHVSLSTHVERERALVWTSTQR